MMRIVIAMTAGLLGLSSVPAAAASLTDLSLFGKDPGQDRAFACYTRHYDASHLNAHPQQNVADMTLLVDSAVDDGRHYNLSLGVNFRRVKNEFDVTGSCSGTIDGKKLLNCGVDCDGGTINVRLKDKNSILVDIPYGARTWDSTLDPEADVEPADNPDATFGADDKTFRLDRTALSNCTDLVWDDADKGLLADAK